MQKKETPLVRGVSTQHLLIQTLTPHVGNSFDVGTVTVFTGPNNSGTSEVLHDIARLAGKFDPRLADRETGDTPTTRVLNDLTLVPKLTLDRLLTGLTTYDSEAADEVTVQGLGPDLRTPQRRNVGPEIRNILYRPVITARAIWSSLLGEFMPLRVFYLTSDDRRALSNRRPPARPCKRRKTFCTNCSMPANARIANWTPPSAMRSTVCTCCWMTPSGSTFRCGPRCPCRIKRTMQSRPCSNSKR